MSRLTVRVPAKVNLQLSVGPPRDDGYHELVNVFHAVSLVDEVTAEMAESVTVAVVGESADLVPVDGGNLAVRAAYALAERTGTAYGVRLSIDKSIPVAGGMAGGSADAAAALIACDRLWGLDLPFGELLEIGAELGSDVPFALLGGTAVGTGRGEVLKPVRTDSSFHWVFALADEGLSTAAVYAECDRMREESGWKASEPKVNEDLLAALAANDAHALGRALVNDLEPAALRLSPSLSRTLAAGRELGALGSIVSGSGPTCAFLAESRAHAHALRGVLGEVCRRALTAHGPVPGALIIDGTERPPRVRGRFE